MQYLSKFGSSIVMRGHDIMIIEESVSNIHTYDVSICEKKQTIQLLTKYPIKTFILPEVEEILKSHDYSMVFSLPLDNTMRQRQIWVKNYLWMEKGWWLEKVVKELIQTFMVDWVKEQSIKTKQPQ